MCLKDSCQKKKKSQASYWNYTAVYQLSPVSKSVLSLDVSLCYFLSLSGIYSEYLVVVCLLCQGKIHFPWGFYMPYVSLRCFLGRIELCKPYNVPCQIMSQQGRMYSTIYGFLWTLEKNLPSDGLVVECGNFPCLLARMSMTFNPSYQFKRNRGPFAIHFAKCGQWFDKWRRLWIIWAQILF